jgi:mannan endo-1,4-beta-mannosidase
MHKSCSSLSKVVLFSLLLASAGCSGKHSSSASAGSSDPTVPASNRPAYNTGVGFFVDAKKLYDANGVEFRIRGVNANHWWDNGTDVDMQSIPYIKVAGANSVRCVFGKKGTADPEFEDPYGIRSTTAERQTVVEEYIKYRIVPIVEFHNATGSNDPAKVTEAVNFWIGEKGWLKKYERYVIVNITNEWCNGSDNKALWRDAYINAVKALRAEGINNAIVIDSIQWAQSVIEAEYYNAVFNADPQKNIIFSFHMYDGWIAPADASHSDGYDYCHVNTGLKYLTENVAAPVIAGEFNFVCAEGSCPDEILLNNLESYNVGWVAWMWYNSYLHEQNMVVNSAGNTYPYNNFGKTIVSYLKNAKEATVFSAALPVLPAAPPDASIDPNFNPGGLTVNYFDVSDGNPWWMSVKMDNANTGTGIITGIQMENIITGEKIPLEYHTMDSNCYVFSVTKNLSAYIAANVRFWIYDINGSTAKTLPNTLVQGNLFGIDTSR